MTQKTVLHHNDVTADVEKVFASKLKMYICNTLCVTPLKRITMFNNANSYLLSGPYLTKVLLK